MGVNQVVEQFVVIEQGFVDTNKTVHQLALFNVDGTPRGVPKKAAAQVDTTAVDLAALKVDFNALLAKLRTAGIIAT